MRPAPPSSRIEQRPTGADQRARAAARIGSPPPDLSNFDEVQLKRSYVFGGRLLKRLAEELGEATDVIRVRIDGGLSKIPQLHVIGHALSEFGDTRLPGSHRETF